MIYNLAHNGNKLITFTIGGTTYQAIDGMTWEEWVNSEYNTDGFYIYNGFICWGTNSTHVDTNQFGSGNPPTPTTKIIPNSIYYTTKEMI